MSEQCLIYVSLYRNPLNNNNIYMSPSFFSDSPNARSKSITTADLDTFGVQCSFRLYRCSYSFVHAPDSESPFYKPPFVSSRSLIREGEQTYNGGCSFLHNRFRQCPRSRLLCCLRWSCWKTRRRMVRQPLP